MEKMDELKEQINTKCTVFDEVLNLRKVIINKIKGRAIKGGECCPNVTLFKK
jgi:hypothetical protein